MIAQEDLHASYDEGTLDFGGAVGSSGFGDEHAIAILVVLAMAYLIIIRKSFKVVLAA